MQWYQVNIYPSTKRGKFSVVVMENKGYHWHCEKHQRNKCRGCADFKRSRMVSSYAVEAPEVYDLTSVIEQALFLVQDDLQDGPSPPRQVLRTRVITPKV